MADRHFTARNIDEKRCTCIAFAIHLQCTCIKTKDLSPMNAKCEAMVDGVLTEYHYNGKDKTLAVYVNKQYVRTLTRDEAVKTWHEIIE